MKSDQSNLMHKYERIQLTHEDALIHIQTISSDLQQQQSLVKTLTIRNADLNKNYQQMLYQFAMIQS